MVGDVYFAVLLFVVAAGMISLPFVFDEWSFLPQNKEEEDDSICDFCGVENEEWVEYCGKCGEKL